MQTLIHTPWLSIGACLLLYLSDVAFTMTCSRLYQSGSNQHLVFEHSLELTPRYQQDVARLRWLSPKFLISLLLLAAVMALVWWIAVDLLGFTLLFLILYPLTQRLFVLGGAFGCLAVAFDHWRKGQKARKAAEA